MQISSPRLSVASNVPSLWDFLLLTLVVMSNSSFPVLRSKGSKERQGGNGNSRIGGIQCVFCEAVPKSSHPYSFMSRGPQYPHYIVVSVMSGSSPDYKLLEDKNVSFPLCILNNQFRSNSQPGYIPLSHCSKNMY